MAKRRRRVTRRNPRKRTRRRRPTRRSASRAGRTLSRYRRNPRIVATLVRGVKDAGAVVLGKAGSNIVAGLIPISGGMAIQVAKQAGAGLVVGMAAQRFLGADVARFVLAGAFSAPIEGFIKGAGIPYVSAALGSYPMVGSIGNGGGVGAYPMLAGWESGDQVGDASADVMDFQQGVQ